MTRMGNDNEHLLRVKDVNTLCLECHGPDTVPERLESQHLIAIFDGKVKLPEKYHVPILSLKYNAGHPVQFHPIAGAGRCKESGGGPDELPDLPPGARRQSGGDVGEGSEAGDGFLQYLS